MSPLGITTLTRNHVDVLCRLRFSAERPHFTDWKASYNDQWRYRTGFNGRTLLLLMRLGLIEMTTLAGPRGGRIRLIRLTDAGNAIAVQAENRIENPARYLPSVHWFSRIFEWKD